MAKFGEGIQEAEKTIGSAAETTNVIQQEFNRMLEWAKAHATGSVLDKVKKIEGQTTKLASEKLESLRAIMPNLPGTPEVPKGSAETAPAPAAPADPATPKPNQATLDDAKKAFHELTQKPSSEDQNLPWYKRVWNKLTHFETITNFFSRAWDGMSEAFDKIFSWPPSFSGAGAALAGIFGAEVATGAVTDAVQQAKETGGKVAEEVKKKIPATPEQQKEWLEKFKAGLIEEYQLKLDKKKMDKLTEILANHAKGLEKWEKWDQGKFGVLENLALTGIDPVKIALELVAEDIIPARAIGIKMMKNSIGMMQVSLKHTGVLIGAAFSGVERVLGEISMEKLNEQYEKLSLPQRQVLMGLVYRETGLLTSFLGSIARAGGELVMMWPTWDERVGITKVKMAYNEVFSKYVSQAKVFDELIVRMGGKGISADVIQMMKKAPTALLIRDAYEKHGNNVPALVAEIEGLMGKNPEMVNTEMIGVVVKKLRGDTAKSAGKALSEVVEAELHGLGKLEGLSHFFNSLPSGLRPQDILGAKANIAAAEETLGRELEVLGKSISESFINPKWYNHLKKLSRFLKTSPIPSSANKLITVSTPTEAKECQEVLNTILIDAPKLLQGILGAAPIILVTGMAAKDADSPGSFARNFASGLSYMIPFVGSIQLLCEGSTLNDGKPIEPGKLFLGGTLLAVDVWGAVKAIKPALIGKGFWNAMGSLGEYMVKPISDMGKVITGSIEATMSIAKAFEIAKLMVQEGKTMELVKTFGKITIGLVIIGFLLYQGGKTLWDALKGPEDMIKYLKKEGLLSADGQNLDIQKIRERFGSFDGWVKKIFIQRVAESVIFGAEELGLEKKVDAGANPMESFFGNGIVNVDKVTSDSCELEFMNIVPPGAQYEIKSRLREFGITPRFLFKQEAIRQYAKTQKANGMSFENFSKLIGTVADVPQMDLQKVWNELGN